jgi:hypothetical protein
MEVVHQTNRKLLTRYFYKENQLCFQILMSANENTSVIGEFSNYSEYRRSFTSLQDQIENGTVIEMNTHRTQRLAQVA